MPYSNPITNAELQDLALNNPLHPRDGSPVEVYMPQAYFMVPPATTSGPVKWRLFDAAYISTGIIDPNRLGTGATGAGNLYLADDGTWKLIGGGGGGDMLKATYDIDNSGIVDKAEALTTLGRNSTGATLYEGTIVRIEGSTGNRPNFVKAQANNDANSAQTFGVVMTDIANNSDGYVLVQGTLHDLDTRTGAGGATNPFTDVTLVDGDLLFLHPTIPGYITNIKPSAPQHLVYVGVVTRTSPTNGTIVYRIQNGYELYELHDVAPTPYINNGVLYRDTTDNLWKSATIATLLGGTPLLSVPTLAQVTTAGNTTTNAISTGLITTTTSAVGNMFVANGANNTLLTVFNDSSGRATITIKGNLSATSAAGAYFGAEGYQEAWFNVYAKAANTGNKYWRFGNIGSGTLNNVFAIQKLTDDGSAIALTALTVFSSTGNVGINTTTDAGYKLDVNGTARVSGALTVNTSNALTATFTNLGDFSNNVPYEVLRLQSYRTVGNPANGFGVAQTFYSSVAQAANSNGEVARFEIAHNMGSASQVASRTFALKVKGVFSGDANYTAFITSVSNNNATYTFTIPTGVLTTNGSITAASAIARGVYFNNTLVAAANNDVLVGLDINPTFTNGAFTGVSNIGVRVQNNVNSIFAGIEIRNPNSGTASGAGINIFNDLGAISVQAISSNYTSAGTTQANTGRIRTGTTLLQGLWIGTGAGSLSFFAQDSEKMRINTNGNILIGTTTDAGYKLDVNGVTRVSGTGTFNGQDAFVVKSSTQFILRVNNDENIIIGRGGGTETYISAVNSGRLLIQNGVGANQTLTGGIQIGTLANYTQATGTQVFTIINPVFNPTGYSDANFSAFVIAPTINQSANPSTVGLSRGLYINPTLVSPKDFRAIETTVGNVLLATTSGNVSIGSSTDAGYKLDVNGTVRLKDRLVIDSGSTLDYPITLTTSKTGNNGTVYLANTSSTGQVLMVFHNEVGGNYSYNSYGLLLYGGSGAGDPLFGANRQNRFMIAADGASNLGMYLGTLSAQPLVFGTNNVERIRINSSGSVGIGTTSPSYKLQVVGDIALSGNLVPTAGSQTLGTFTNRFGDVWAGGLIVGTTFYGDNYQTASGTMFFKDGGGVERMRMTSVGNFLIGTGVDAGYKLAVIGNTRFSSATDTYHRIESSATGSAGTIYKNTYREYFTGTNYATANSWEVYDLTASAPVIHVSGPSRAVGINKVNASYQLDVEGAFRSTQGAYFATTSGFVGIGTTSPAYLLDVNGSVNSLSGYSMNGVAGWTGTITIVGNPPGQQNVDVQGGIIVNVF